MDKKKNPALSALVIRSAAKEDAETLRALFRRASLAAEGGQELLALHPEWLVWDETMLPFVRVAVVDGQVVGFASARPAHGFLELEDLFTDPGWMRQGVARALIEDIRRRGVPIEVTANPYALGFYESVGFARIGTADTQGDRRRGCVSM